MHLLDNYTIDSRTRYENHTLFYTAADSDPIELRGFLAAAILAALLVDTDEGDVRAIALDTEEEQAQFFLRYDREVRREDWGYLSAEIYQLRDNYVQISLRKYTNSATITSSLSAYRTVSLSSAPINAFSPSRWNCWRTICAVWSWSLSGNIYGRRCLGKCLSDNGS